MPSIPGLRSPCARVVGFVDFGRMLDKIRLLAAGHLAGKPVEIFFDLIDFDEGRDPAATNAWL